MKKSMQEFIFGLVFGLVVGRIRKPPPPKKDTAVQADELVIHTKSASISIPRRIPYLVNFWGPDSA